MQKEKIKEDLLASFGITDNDIASLGSGEMQEKGCLKAIESIGDIESDNGTFSFFMIELRDFLLKYIENI